MKKVRHAELLDLRYLPLDISFGVDFFSFWVVVMSASKLSKKYFPLKKVLLVDRGEEVPEQVEVLKEGDRYIYAGHSSLSQAKKDLIYEARCVGANTLLHVYVRCTGSSYIRYIAYGVPAISGRPSINGTHTAQTLIDQFKFEPLPPPPPPDVKKEEALAREQKSAIRALIGCALFLSLFLYFYFSHGH